MEQTRPVYKKILIAALCLYIVGTAVFLAQLTYRLGEVEHILDHVTGAH